MALRTVALRHEISRHRSLLAHGALGLALAVTLALGLRRGGDRAVLRPTDDGHWLAHVPARDSREGRAMAELEERARAAPGSLQAALELAHAHITRARRDGDPRSLGHAEAALAAFASTPSPELLVLRATIRQARHDFAAALVDLDAALGLAPDDAQARLTRASILSVLGRYDEARRDCAALERVMAGPVASACSAQIDGVTGHAARARAALETALGEVRSPADAAWLYSLLGELDYWLARPEPAERALLKALRLAPDDRYTRGLYADLLLDQGRAAEVPALLRDKRLDDGLNLRLVLAAQATHATDAEPLLRAQRERLDEGRLRGDAVHQREEARLALATGRFREALERALQNFRVQREPWDVRLVLLAALRSGSAPAARPALDWLRETGNESPHLLSLAARLEETK